jgi:hypothetical protein
MFSDRHYAVRADQSLTGTMRNLEVHKRTFWEGRSWMSWRGAHCSGLRAADKGFHKALQLDSCTRIAAPKAYLCRVNKDR